MNRGLAAGVLAMLLAACAAHFGQQVEPPEVRLAGLAFGPAEHPEQELRLDLRVVNPNDFEIGVDSMTFDLEVDDIRFASGDTSGDFELPARGERVVPVTLSVPTADLLARVAKLGVERRLDYLLTGEAEVDGLSVGKLPFQYRGVLALPRIPGITAPGS